MQEGDGDNAHKGEVKTIPLSVREHQIVHHVCRAAAYLSKENAARMAAESEACQQKRLALHEEADRYRTEYRHSWEIALKFGTAIGFPIDPIQ